MAYGKTDKLLKSTSDEFRNRLSQLIRVLNVEFEAYYSKRFKNLDIPVVKIDLGTRYIKLKHQDGIYCFIDATNGDILKAATWRAPAKHARGNIYKVDWLESFGPYGTKYLRGGGNFTFSQNDKRILDIAKDALIEWRTDDACKILTDWINTPYDRDQANGKESWLTPDQELSK